MTIKSCALSAFLLISLLLSASSVDKVIYKSDAYSIYPDKIVQGSYEAKAVNDYSLSSNYKSIGAESYSPTITFKFSINSRDNEMISNKDHIVTLNTDRSKTSHIIFGAHHIDTLGNTNQKSLAKNYEWIVKLDMRHVLKDFEKQGYFVLYNGDRLYKDDFKSIHIAGGSIPLSWDFVNLHTRPDLELKDINADGIYEIKLILNPSQIQNTEGSFWSLKKNIDQFPLFQSDNKIATAIYNLSLEEMINAVEPDSTFRTGKEWSGVWTRDISYSIILSMAYLQPQVSKYSLMRKVNKDRRIIQDTGTGGAYPVSTDRMIWAVAAWEIYKATGEEDWLKYSYEIIKNSLEDDLKNIYNFDTGLVKGESSFLDWREQTYPRWMQSADIYNSENLGTNAVHYQANKILAEMAIILGDSKVFHRHSELADKIKEGMNKYLWMEEKGYYGQYLYGRNSMLISPRSEALGEALCVLFGIADLRQKKSIIANTPVTSYGITCIYPQIPNIPPYHNNGIWPFVQAYWGLASGKMKNEVSVMETIAAMYRQAGFFLTNKENFVAQTGDYAGTQINSSNMLWSLAGNIAMVHRVLFGISLESDGLHLNPVVPENLGQGILKLMNFKYRKSILNIEIVGFGSKIQSFEVNGKKSRLYVIPKNIKGIHNIKIILEKRPSAFNKINKVENNFSVETPVCKYENNTLIWDEIVGADYYKVMKNGKSYVQTYNRSIRILPREFSEFQVIAVDRSGVESFASEPIVIFNGRVYELELENFTVKSDKNYKNYSGDGFVEISVTENTSLSIPIRTDESGVYSVRFRYANGNGPINTENKCAIRSLFLDEKFSGTIVMPHRGTNEWSNWGYSNEIKVPLKKGENLLQINYESNNQNMNIDINQAMLDKVEIRKLN